MRKWLRKAAVSILTVVMAVSLITVKTPTTMVRAEKLSDATGMTGGYLEMPWDNDVPAVDTGLSYSDARDMLVDNPLALDKGRITGDFDETIPSAWPYSYSDDDQLIQYFDTVLPSLKNQGSEGTCWAHSAISLVENYLLFNNGSDLHGTVSRNANGDTPAVNYSELHLAYFYYHNNINPIIPNQTGDKLTYNMGDNESFKAAGGNLLLAAETLTKWRGAVDETLVPYSMADNFTSAAQLKAESGLSDDIAYKEDVAHLTSAYTINIHTNPNQVKQAIKENGAVGVSFYASGNYYDNIHNAFFNYVNASTNHAVNIVGWDDDFPKEYFGAGTVKPSSNGAWLVRNSWMDGTKYSGSDYLDYYGYFWMSYEDTSLNDAAYVFEAESADDYDNNYYYTNQIHNTGTYSVDKVANVFTVNGENGAEQESIDAVVIQTTDSGVSYSISIYSVDENGKPFEPIRTNYLPTTGTIVYPGIYTIPLTETPVLERGTKFAVVVETVNGNISLEYDYYSPNCYTRVKANPGESFYYYYNDWRDFSSLYSSNYGNFCIQALTTDRGALSAKSVEGLSVSERTQDSISLVWESLTDAEGYNVYRAANLDSADSFERIASGVEECTYTDSGIAANSVCYYRIIPVIGGAEVPKRASGVVSAAVKPSYTLDSSATITSTDALVHGDDGYRQLIYGECGRGTDGCKLQYKSSSGTDEWKEINVSYNEYLTGKEWRFYVDDIPAGKYILSVTPYIENKLGERAYGESTEAEFVAKYPAPKRPDATYDSGTGKVTISWKAVNGASAYAIFYKLADSTSNIITQLGVSDGTSYVHESVESGKAYNYFVYVYEEDSADSCINYSLPAEVSVTLSGKQILKANYFWPSHYGEQYYTGKSHEATIEKTSNSLTDIGTITVYYAPEGSTEWTTVKPVNAGTYAVAIDVAETDTYDAAYKLTDDDWILSISTITLTVIPNDSIQKEEGDEDPVLTYSYKGNVEGEIPGFTGTLSRDPGEEMGQYTIHRGTLELADNGSFLASNYVIYFYDNYASLNIYGIVFDRPVISVVSKDRHSAKFEWGAIRKADGYAIYDSDDELIGKTQDLSFEVTDLEADRDYQFKVYPYRNGKDIDFDFARYGTITVQTDPRIVPTADNFTATLKNAVYDGYGHGGEVVSKIAGITIKDILYTDEEHPTWWTKDLPIDAGNYYVAINTERTDDYEQQFYITDPSWIFTIERAPNNLEIPQALNRVFVSGDGPLVSINITGNLEYSLGTDEVNAPTNGWSSDIPWGKNAGKYYVWYRALNQHNYLDIDPTCIVVTIDKAEDAPLKPSSTMDVYFSVKKVKDVELYPDWVWAEEDANKEFVGDESIVATAEYVGEEKGNYINESVQVTITRRWCLHENLQRVPAKDPTAAEDGNTEYWICLDCGKYFSDEGHSIIEKDSWIIPKTGQDEPEIKYGDADGDGVINAKDVTVLRRHLAGGWSVTVNLANADVNADGIVNAKDVTILRRYLAGGWGVELGKE